MASWRLNGGSRWIYKLTVCSDTFGYLSQKGQEVAIDAVAICEALSRPGIPSVPVKSKAQ